MNDGGPAFPQIETEPMDVVTRAGEYTTIGRVNASGGISVRDYFAAKELASLGNKTICDVPEGYARIADHCYRMADAMIAARDY